jgi:hypothetical protein
MTTKLPYSNATTSRAAAHAARGSAKAQRLLVLGALRNAGDAGLTREDLQYLLDLPGDSVRPRVWQLLQQGLIAVSDRQRATFSGRIAEVLVSTPTT